MTIIRFEELAALGAVAIGRNEGERLRCCLASLRGAAAVVYVDSGSTDGSVEWARGQGIEVVDLNRDLPFTAARARNAGFLRLGEIAPHVGYVQFVDGDCEVDPFWLGKAVGFLDSHPNVAAVAGRLKERFPQRSTYNWLCDREWDGPVGEVGELGGNMAVRASKFRSVGGFREDLIAGEEPELCVRFRLSGARVWRLSDTMAVHDASMTRFGQWWRRAVRSGYAYAHGALLHGASPERHYVWECQRAWLWGAAIPVLCVALFLALWPWGWLALLVYPLQIARQTLRQSGPFRDRFKIALFQTLTRFAEAWGQLRFLCDRLLRRRALLIEYK